VRFLRIYGFQLRLLRHFSRPVCLSLLSFIIYHLIHRSAVYVYHFSIDKFCHNTTATSRMGSSNYVFATPLIDYKFFHNFIPYLESVNCSSCLIVSLYKSSRTLPAGFMLSSKVKLNCNILKILLFTFFSEFNSPLLAIANVCLKLNDQIADRILSIFDLDNTHVFFSDPVNPILINISYRLSQLNKMPAIVLNSAYLQEFEYIYYNRFKCLAKSSLFTPSSSLIKCNKLRKVIEYPSHIKKNHPSALSQQTDKKTLLFISQPNESSSMLRNLYFQAVELYLVISLCMITVFSRKYLFRYRPHPRDNIGFKLLIVTAFRLANIGCIKISNINAVDHDLSSATFAFSRDSTLALQFLALNPTRHLFTTSKAFCRMVDSTYYPRLRYLPPLEIFPILLKYFH
jgi:hypothetical protein